MSLSLSPKITVKDLLNRYPQLLKTFVDLKLKCPGCPIEAFHTLADVAQQNRLDLDQLLGQLLEKMKNNGNLKNTLTDRKRDDNRQDYRKSI